MTISRWLRNTKSKLRAFIYRKNMLAMAGALGRYGFRQTTPAMGDCVRFGTSINSHMVTVEASESGIELIVERLNFTAQQKILWKDVTTESVERTISTLQSNVNHKALTRIAEMERGLGVTVQ